MASESSNDIEALKAEREALKKKNYELIGKLQKKSWSMKCLTITRH